MIINIPTESYEINESEIPCAVTQQNEYNHYFLLNRLITIRLSVKSKYEINFTHKDRLVTLLGYSAQVYTLELRSFQCLNLRNYINGGVVPQHHSVFTPYTRRKTSTLTTANILYLKSLGCNVRTITVILGSTV